MQTGAPLRRCRLFVKVRFRAPSHLKVCLRQASKWSEGRIQRPPVRHVDKSGASCGWRLAHNIFVANSIEGLVRPLDSQRWSVSMNCKRIAWKTDAGEWRRSQVTRPTQIERIRSSGLFTSGNAQPGEASVADAEQLRTGLFCTHFTIVIAPRLLLSPSHSLAEAWCNESGQSGDSVYSQYDLKGKDIQVVHNGRDS